MEYYQAVLNIDGRNVLWTSLPYAQKESDTRESLLEASIEDHKANGAKTVEVRKWIH